MVLDSSAVIAVVFREEQHEQLEEAMAVNASLSIGAPTLFETAMVAIANHEMRGHDLVAHFLEERGVEVIPFDLRHWEVAAAAFDRFGKGRHPAALNFGDCMTYASARVAGRPLLFIGNDFARTDIAPA
jgi:ribonuclease VapC